MKKTLAMLLALCMIFALCACTVSPDEETLAEIDDLAARVKALEAGLAEDAGEAEETAEEAAGEEKILKIGVLANETGWFAAYDLNNVYEAQALADIINEDGGVKIGSDTYKIELVVEDGQSDAEGIRSAAMLIQESGAQFVLETNDFWVVSCQDIFENNNIMHISANNAMDYDALNPDAPLAYTCCSGGYGLLVTGIAALKEYYPDVKSVCFCISEDGTVDAKMEIIQAVCDEYGYELYPEAIVYDGSATDMTSTALQILATGCDYVACGGTMPSIGAILKEIRANGSDMIVGATVGQPADLLLSVCGEDAATGTFTLGVSFEQENNTELFWKIYQRVIEDYGEETASSFTGNFANSLYELIYTMEQCESVDPLVVSECWNNLDEIDSIYGMCTLGGEELFGLKNRAVNCPLPVSKLEDGEVVFAGWVDVAVP